GGVWARVELGDRPEGRVDRGGRGAGRLRPARQARGGEQETKHGQDQDCHGADPSHEETGRVTRDAEELLSRIRSIPYGHVTTYGDLAPGAPRFAGAVLSECEDPSVPWQRVVRADGSLAKGER